MTQKERILQYIEDFGSITAMQAFSDLGITKLATRISELTFEGVRFKKTIITGQNRYGEPTHWTKYELDSDNRLNGIDAHGQMSMFLK